jgi:imidazolonepropionase-like amidohydrolase
MGVRIADGVITEVVPWAEAAERVDGPVVDYGGSTVCPGFIDAHVHLLFTYDIEHSDTRRDVEEAPAAVLGARAVEHALQALTGGVTTVRDCGDKDLVTLAVRDAIAAGALPGPRILAAGPPLTIPDGHLNWCGNVVASEDEIRASVRNLARAGVDLVKVMSSGGRMTAESNPSVPQFEESEMAAAVEEAHAANCRVAAHALNAESIRRSVAAGVDTVEHCLWGDGAPGPDDVAELLELMAAGTSSPVITMAGIARALLPAHDAADPREAEIARAVSSTGDLRQDFDFARQMFLAGVNVVVASDAGVRFTPFHRFDESIQCGRVGLGVTLSEAIRLVTHNAAVALGIGDQVGLIEPGMRADLVVLDQTGSPDTIGTVSAVFRDGVRLVDAGQLTWTPSWRD